MRIKKGMWLVAGLILAGQAGAIELPAGQKVISDSEWLQLSQRRNCWYCHEAERDGLGPSLQEIAMEYAGQEDAEERLFFKVYFGGVGKWGSTMMPAQNPPATREEIRALVRYMLMAK